MYLQSSLLFVGLVSGGIFTVCFVGSFPAVVVVLSVGSFRILSTSFLFVLFVFVCIGISSVDFHRDGFDSPFKILFCGFVLWQLCLRSQLSGQTA